MERFPYLIPHFPCRKYAGKQQEKKLVGRCRQVQRCLPIGEE
ncbi:hypothetical protein ACTQV0_06825 [Selenomonas montiformis]